MLHGVFPEDILSSPSMPCSNFGMMSVSPIVMLRNERASFPRTRRRPYHLCSSDGSQGLWVRTFFQVIGTGVIMARNHVDTNPGVLGLDPMVAKGVDRNWSGDAFDEELPDGLWRGSVELSCSV